MMILKKGKMPQECEQCEMISVAEKASWKNDTLHLMYLREVNISLKRDARETRKRRNLELSFHGGSRLAGILALKIPLLTFSSSKRICALTATILPSLRTSDGA